MPFDKLISAIDPNKFISKYEVDLSSKSLNMSKDSLLLIYEPGEITNKNIILINHLNSIHKLKFLGWLLLDNKTKLI